MKAKTTIVSAVAFAATFAFADPADPQVSKVQVSQDDSRRVTVTYHLDEDAIVTMDVLTNGVSIGGANINHVYGDCNKKVSAGDRVFYWKPHKSWPGKKITEPIVSVKVTAWAKDCPPDYMVVNLLTKNCTYYPGADFVPGGVGDREYKTNKMIFSKIPAGGKTVTIGASNYSRSPLRDITFTKDFYLAIYECTQKQFALVNAQMDSSLQLKPSFSGDDRDVLPMETFTVSGKTWTRGTAGDMRGTKNDSDNKTYKPDLDPVSGSVCGKFGEFSGKEWSFDLPTLAQWEFAARAGSYGTKLYGNYSAGDIAWYKGNSSEKTHEVGLWAPNAYGLYDMVGNVSEYVRDAYMDNVPTSAATDPLNTTFNSNSQDCRLGCSYKATDPSISNVERGNSGWTDCGLRLMAIIP